MFGFEEALRLLKMGAFVRRKGWPGSHHLRMIDGRICDVVGCGSIKKQGFDPPHVDLISDDWVLHSCVAKLKRKVPARSHRT